MGTNYYWISDEGKCPRCGRSDNEEKHIGKSSGGWCFSLRVYPDEGINTLEDWEERFPFGTIRDEYGDTLTPAKMSSCVRDRGSDIPWPDKKWVFDRGLSQVLRENHAIEGPNNLLRHDKDSPYSSCVGYGEGTWDYIDGEFS